MKSLFRFNILLVPVLMLAVASCVKKDDFYKKATTETNRKQTVQITGASDIITFARDVKSTNDTFILIDVRRYPNDAAQLNQPLTVKLAKNSSLITTYNNANGTGYIELPSNAYTLLSDISSITFQPGEAVKEIKISVDQSKLDLTKQYALGFSITDAGSNAVAIPDLKDGLYNIGVKNKYDGKYSILSGIVTRYTSPGVPANDALSGSIAGNPDLTLSTVGSNTVEITGLQWAYGNNSGVAGIDNLRLTVDPTTNQVTMFSLGNATLANWAGKPNYYDPATKTFYLNFRWNPTANVREYSMVIKYKGPR